MRSAAVFMLALIVLLPINTSIVYGDRVGNVVITGTDGIEGVLRPYDFTMVSADVRIDDSVVDPANVKYGDKDSFIHFNQCSGTIGEVHECEYTSSQLSLQPGKFQYKITVVDDGGDSLASASGPVIVDGTPPSVISMSVGSQFGDENIKIEFTVLDYAKEGDSTTCSGLKEIELRESSTITSKALSGSCSHSGSIEVESSDVGAQGDYEICLVATDKLNHVSEPKCKDITLDTDSPNLLSSTILGLDLKPVTYILDPQIVLEVNISEQDTEISTSDVKANFTEILDSSYGFKAADSCTPKDGIYTCIWKTLYTINETGSYTIPLQITDSMGNTLETNLRKTIYIDSTHPKVNWIRSDIVYAGISYLKEKNNTITASIDDTGSGISNENIFLDTNKLNKNLRMPAINCSNYICFWYADADYGEDGDRYLSITKDSVDNTGNRFDIKNGSRFILITKKPEVKYANWSTYGKYSSLNLSYAVIGDQILFNFTIPYSVSPTMEGFADFRELTGNPHNETPGTCTKDFSTWYCEFTTILNASGTKDTHFTFRDVVGNKDYAEFTLDIKYEENETERNWNYRVLSVSPENIDRQTTTLINHKVYANIQFVPDSGVVGEAIDLLGCTADKPRLVYDVKRIDTAPNKEWLKTTLQATKFNDTDELDIICTHKILSLVDDEYINEELLNVTYTINFYNMPLGELSDSVQDEIDRVNESWLVQQEWLDTAYKLLQVYNTLCRVVGMIENIRLILCALRDLTCPTSDPAATQMGKMCESSTEAGTTAWEGVNKFCKANSCLVLGLMGEKGDSIKKWFSRFYGSENFMEQSLPLSMLFICLKGLVQNLQKARIIECQYIQCLNSEVPSGKPLQACTMTRGYMQCKWIYGQLFNLIPFAAVFSKFAQDIDRVLTDPVTAVNMAASFICGYACKPPKVCGYCSTCTFLSILNRLVNLYKDLEEMGKEDYSGFDIGDSVCQDVLGTGE